MPAIIDSAPDCIIHINGAKPADDSADFILQAAYAEVPGHHDLRPRLDLRRGRHRRRRRPTWSSTWIGIIVMVAVIVAWVLYEDRRLWGHVARIRARDHGAPLAGPTDPPVTE